MAGGGGQRQKTTGESVREALYLTARNEEIIVRGGRSLIDFGDRLSVPHGGA